jgi:hypothetical protein
MVHRPGRFWLGSQSDGPLADCAVPRPTKPVAASLAACHPDADVTGPVAMAARLRRQHACPPYLTAGSDNPRHWPLPGLAPE